MELPVTLPESTQIRIITITEPAAEAVRALIEKRNLQDHALRIYVSGAGCSGFQYGMALDQNVRAEDTVIESNGIKVLVDEVSIQYINGSSVDYVDGPTGPAFKIDNPNKYASCCDHSSGNSGGCSGCH